jgi:plastocyanin
MPKPLPGVLVATVLALAGCGGDDKKGDDGGEKSRDAVTVGHNQPIAFGASEYAFQPKTVTVYAGTSQPSVVRFVLRNNGSLAHDLHIQKDGSDLGGTAIFGPGKVESGEAKLGPGTYEFLCTVGDHAALGMKGKLVVSTKKVTRPADPDAGAGGEEGDKDK